LNDESRASAHLEQELRDLVADKIGGYKGPRWIEFVAEIPKTATGKLQRFKLREMQEHHTAPDQTKGASK
jgi:acyl-coenzyme A synthetase/AMP-(fatty) acid ligase